MFYRWLIVGLAAVPALADDVGLIRVGQSWRYWPATSEPSTQSNAWQQAAFDDSKWLPGISGFGSEGTPLPKTPENYVSVYFRKPFAVAQPEQIKWLTLRIDYNDGFVAYLNGREIARQNMSGPPGRFVPYNATATNAHPRTQIEEFDVSSYAPLLTRGTNVLAFQLHSVLAQGFGISLIPEFLANFTRGPFIQNASSTNIQIIWKTLAPADTRVEYGTNTALGTFLSNSNLMTTHAVTLTNLLPDTTYYYRALSSANGLSAASPVEWFRTLKNTGSLSFAVLGDSGAGSLAQHAIAEVIRNTKPDLVLHAGDVIYPSFTFLATDTRCLSVYGPHMKNVPYYFAFGNHDLNSGSEPFLEAFYLPTNNVPISVHATAGTSPEHYYSFDHGDAHFTVLFVPFLSQYELKVDDPQHKWLAADLAGTKKPWKFLLFHHPIITSSLHRFDDYNSNGIADRVDVMNAVLPLASKYGVQLIFTGHDHVYERFNPIKGVHSIVTGGGGVGLYPLTELDPASAQFWIRHNCVKVTVEGDRLFLQALTPTGDVFDSMTIYRALPPPRTYQAGWNSVAVDSKPANDDDGNVNGQEFSFLGTPIPTLPGQFSNLGQFYVNNDRTHLYVGIEQCMINPDNNIFLFLEAPRQSGVKNLAQIGNGKVDPNGEGADGLDFLGNLSFTNFTPSVGCILGDEFADSQSRSFGRSGLGLKIGQGVFRLDAAISDVPGVRFEQFNRSPQTGGVPGEQNANFIKLAIPFSSLGNLQPGEVIKLGAVVGGSGFDLNAAQQARQLDSSFLGTGLAGSGLGPVILEGLSVQLAIDPDPDGDGLANDEEKRLGTNPNNPDSDGDGLPDGWEAAFGLNPLSAAGDDGASGDPDKDGFSNLSEWIAGTNPRDPKSALRVTLEALGGQRYRITWLTVVGKKYQIQISSNPLTGYSDLASTNFPVRAASTVQSYEEDLKNSPPASRFYRIRVLP